MRIDLHTHSTASDGTLAPADIVRAAAASGLDAVALTDHDTSAGWAAAAAALPQGLTLVPGAELSCRWFGTEPSIALHLLAYLFDPAHPELAAALERVRVSRESRARRMVNLLRADGVAVDWDEIRAAAGGGSIGRTSRRHWYASAWSPPCRPRSPRSGWASGTASRRRTWTCSRRSRWSGPPVA